MLIIKTKRMRGIEEKENESISECIIVKDKEEETNMEGRRKKHWKKEKKYGMKEKVTLNEKEINIEWRRKEHWMKEKQIWDEGEYWMKEEWIWNEGERNIVWKRNGYEMKEKQTFNERGINMEWKRKEHWGKRRN